VPVEVGKRLFSQRLSFLPASLARASAVAMGALLGLVACSKPPTADECQGLVRRYAETLVDKERSGLSHGERERLIAQAVTSATSSPAFRACPQKVSRASIECAKNAFNPDEIERCLIDIP
jgi:hypothetical protein